MSKHGCPDSNVSREAYFKSWVFEHMQLVIWMSALLLGGIVLPWEINQAQPFNYPHNIHRRCISGNNYFGFYLQP